MCRFFLPKKKRQGTLFNKIKIDTYASKDYDAYEFKNRRYIGSIKPSLADNTPHFQYICFSYPRLRIRETLFYFL